jgi:hypothetical protein
MCKELVICCTFLSLASSGSSPLAGLLQRAPGAKSAVFAVAGYFQRAAGFKPSIPTVTVKSFHPGIISTDEDLLLVIDEASRLRQLKHP